MIRRLEIKDIPKLAKYAEEFYASSEFLAGFNIDIFRASWEKLIGSGMGVIFILEDETEIYGALGAVKYPDFNSGQLIACEMFWYVAQEKRGEGLSLLDAFEKWAKDEGCKYINMTYLADSMPEIIKRIYERRGYTLAEVAYKKEVT